VLRAVAVLATALLIIAAKEPEPRRIAVRLSEGIPAPAALESLAERAKGRGIELQIATEGTSVPRGFDVAHLSTLPPPETLRTALARFPVAFEGGGFTFDGRTFSGKEDALFLSDPVRPAEALVLGASPRSVLALAAEMLLERSPRGADYVAVSGDLTKEGRFAAGTERLAVDRASDRDRIAEREAFYKSLVREKHGTVEWERRASEAEAAARWEKVAARYTGKHPFSVRVFPDAVAKALFTGSGRPADLVVEEGRVVVEIDASAPAEPDLVEPVLAAAGVAAGNPALLERPWLALADGARKVGRWWGREVRGFAAFTHAAGVDPSLEDAVRGSDDASPVLTVGAAAAWLDAGARLDGEAAVEKALGEPEGNLGAKLVRWREASWRQAVRPPTRRPLPDGFVRGFSFAMTNTVEGGYASAASLEALRHLKDLGADSIAVLPYGFVRDPGGDRVLFMHRTARGETDEAIVRAVVGARALGMTAMIQPQLWVGGGASVADIAPAEGGAGKAWFDSYRAYVVHHAVVAEAAGAAIFCVGSDLTKVEGRERDWRNLVAAVRLSTGAPLVYAAAGAASASRVPFWDLLDAIGVNFFDPLAGSEKAKDPALEAGVRDAARPLADLAARTGKPVLFTEAGYPWTRAPWIAPRVADLRRPAGGEDSSRAVAAVYRALGGETWWRGVYWWKTFSDGKPAAANERGYNVLGTPAEKTIAEGFRRKSAP
jgi:hypothetical protein